jgi:acyl-CoA thioesterase
MEAVAGRPVIWATAQYLSFAAGTDPIGLEVAIEVAGHHTTQARCVVSRGGVEILTTHAALGHRDLDVEGAWCAPPEVPGPGDCPRYRFFEHGLGHIDDLAFIGDFMPLDFHVGRAVARRRDAGERVRQSPVEGPPDLGHRDRQHLGGLPPLARRGR